MDVVQALEVLGLEPGATREDVEHTYREIRKPLLKQLNRHDEGEEPEGLVKMLDSVETAFRVITSTPHTPLVTPKDAPVAKQAEPPAAKQAAPAQRKSTGRVTGLQPGLVIGDRYEIKGHISHRPEGDTYRVHDRVRDVELALKLIDVGLVRNARQRARLHQGVLAASRLNHPNLARVLDVVRMQHTLAVLQELPAGENLWELMYGAEELREKLTQDVVHNIAEQAAHALAYVHTEMAHAALRPESIWVDDDGNVKISDLGLADLQRPLRDKRLSRAKLGTAYWAPEQYRDDVAVGARSDQYALSLILYEILSGKPSVGRTASIRSFRRDYPRRLTAAIERGLSSKGPQRFADMDEFGYAAIPAYRTEQAAPTGVALGSILVPVLVLLGLFAGFVVSPLGRQAADAIGTAAGRWDSVEEQESLAYVDLRQLQAISDRLHERQSSLEETSREELARVRKAIAANEIGAKERAQARYDLTQVVRQLVDTSRRKAEDGFERAMAALDAFEAQGKATWQASDETDGAETELSSSTPEERNEKVIELVYRQAGSARRKAFWREQRQQLVARPVLAESYRALLEAEAALEIGDEAATGQSYDVAAAKLTSAAESAEAAVEAIQTFDPFDASPGIAKKVEVAQCRACVTAWLGEPSAWTEDDELARMLKGLWAEGFESARARWLVNAAGYWVLETAIGSTVLSVGGTWDDDDGVRRLQVTVVNGVPLETRIGIPAEHGDPIPDLDDLRAALAAVPRDARALWSRQSSEQAALPKPVFETPDRTMGPGDVDVRGTLPEASDACCVLVNRRRVEAEDGKFGVQVRVPGDVLRTSIRAHAAHGLRSGPAVWMRVRADVLKPRVHPLYPAPGVELEAGSTQTILAIVYDSNLETLEIKGEAMALSRDEVVRLIKHTVTVPAQGALELPVRAVDAAGNEKIVTWTWPAR